MTKTIRPVQGSLLSAAACLTMFVGSAHASLGNTGSTFGLSPTDIASAQSFSLFNAQPSAAYYNPAALSGTHESEVYTGLLSATPDISFGNKQFEDATQPILLGMKLNLGEMLDLPVPVHMGLISGIENFGSEMMAFDSHTSKDGQLTNYGEKPLFVAASGSVELYPGLSFGAGAQISLHAKADMKLESELDGSSAGNENVFVSAEPVITPIAGFSFDFGKMWCGYDLDCSGDGVTLAGSFRGESYGKAVIGANATIPDVVVELAINLTTYDAYQPNIMAAGIRIKKDFFTLSISAEQQEWSALNELMLKDTVKDQASLGFKDTVVPRVGLEINFSDRLKVIVGASQEESPLDPKEATLNVNYLSADKTVYGAGLIYQHRGDGAVEFPWQISVAYQMQKLSPTENKVVHEDIKDSLTEEVKGSVSSVAVSFSSRF